MSKHPIQPLEIDKHGTLRFKENTVVRYLLDNGGIDLNQIAMKRFPKEEMEHFMQLIGYSLSGAGSLSCVSEELYASALAMYESGISEKDARIAYLEGVIAKIKLGMKIIIPELYSIHEDDLDDEYAR